VIQPFLRFFGSNIPCLPENKRFLLLEIKGSEEHRTSLEGLKRVVDGQICISESSWWLWFGK
jgi:hypothetical protein